MVRVGACLALALSLAPRHLELPRFHPREASTVDKSFELQTVMRLTRLQLDERDMYVGFPPITLRMAADVADTYERVGYSRPLAMKRRFRDIALKWEQDGMREDLFGFHPLSGCTVRYLWQPREQRYETELVEGRCREYLLRGLVEDFDLRGLLPDSEVKPGASWIASGPSMLESLFAPARLALTGISEDRKLECRIRDVLVRPFLELAKKQAELRCTPVELFESNASRFLRIALAHADRYTLDITDEMNECLRSDDPRLASWDLSVVDFELKWRVGGEGELLWNLDEGRCESLDLEAPLELEGSFELWFDKQRQFTVRFGAEGRCTWTVRAR